jgi:hypothetical protein
MTSATTPDSPKSEAYYAPDPLAHAPRPSDAESRDGHAHGSAVCYTPQQEARVVRKLDLNLMTLFFVLCECNTAPALSPDPRRRNPRS